MAKSKKKDKKKKKEKEPEKEVSETEESVQFPLESSLITTLTAKKGEGDAFDNAIEDTKETHAALTDLLAGTIEGDGFYRRAKEEDKIQPQLHYTSENKQIVDDYLIEEVPLTERKIGKNEIKQRTRLAETKPPSHPPSEPSGEPPDEPGETKVEELTEESPEGTSSVIEEPSFTQKEPESIYPKLSEFFTNLLEGNSKRYDQWEESISSILSILRKMRKVTKKNTEELVLSINNSYKRVQAGLEEFKIKREEVQRVSEVNLENLSTQFKKVLGLLELQVKEYQLKLITDDYIHNL